MAAKQIPLIAPWNASGAMSAMRAANREKIRLRGEQSRRDAKNYLQGKIREKVA